MQVGPTSQTEGLVPEINLDALQRERIVAQLDLETAQTQIHFVELIAQTHRAVLAHDPLDLHEEEPVQILVRIQQPQMMSAPGKATLRTHAGGGVLAHMIELLQPTAELLIELLQSLDGLSGQLQLAFKILLNGSKESFNLSLAPGVVGLGGNAPAADGLLERLVKGLGIGPLVVSGKRNQPAMIVDDQTQLSGQGLFWSPLQIRPGRKINHPQIVGKRSFEGFGGTGKTG